MNPRIIATAALTLLLCVATALGASYPPRTFPKRIGGPTVAFGDTAVMAQGATPGAKIHFAGVVLLPGDYVIRVKTAAGETVADANGTATFAAELDTRSVWVVVDSGSGGYTVAAPHGMLLREIDFPGHSDEGASGQVRQLLLQRYAIDAFLIRPGQGIWSAYLRDGGDNDEDHEINGRLEANLASLRPVGEAPPSADRLMPGDLLFMVDRNTLEFHVLKRGN